MAGNEEQLTEQEMAAVASNDDAESKQGDLTSQARVIQVLWDLCLGYVS